MTRALWGALFVSFLLSPSLLHAQSSLDAPAPGSFQGGLGFIAGWKCTGGTLTFTIDNGSPGSLVYGSERGDTQGQCGHSNTGFIAQFNWNLVGSGQHTIQVFDNGVQFAQATFTVQTLGHEYLSGLPQKQGTVVNFDNQVNVKVQWQESCQCFVIVDSTAPIRLGPPTGVDLGPSVPLCEQPDAKRSAYGGAAYTFAQQAGFLRRQVGLCAVSTDNPRLYVQLQGNTYPISGNALSHPQGYIFYDVTLLNEADGIDPFGSTFILAHELGHQVQYDNPAGAAVGNPQRELQADCFGGIYLGHLAATGQFTSNDVSGIAEAICGLAVGRGFVWGADTTSHGTCEQRVIAAKTGGIAEYNWEINHISYNPFQVCSF